MIAQTLALALVLASPGARPALEPLPDNAVRARHGLLPRKVVRARAPARGRRVVLLPPAPTWLGEPGEGTEPAPEALFEPAVDAAAEPLAARVEPAVAALTASPEEAPPTLVAALEGAAVEWLVLRRRHEPEAPAVEATISEPELQAVLVRRRPAP